MRVLLALSALALAGCASGGAPAPGPLDCSTFREESVVVPASKPISLCYVVVYDPASWGHMSASMYAVTGAIASTWPETVGAMPMVNGFLVALRSDSAAVLARAEGVTVYECDNSNGVSDLDAIVYLERQAQKADRKLPQPAGIRDMPRISGAVGVATCTALEKIAIANASILDEGIDDG